ncbi:MAG TPA: hypothetical protein PLJ21_01850 [Pseudobdellovibrionaceae bacterium]|nr:hypothetical protein [Pseudobdellovibrionaceae bacterium]
MKTNLIFLTCLLLTNQAFSQTKNSDEYFRQSNRWQTINAQVQNENLLLNASFYKLPNGNIRLNRVSKLNLTNTEILFNYKDTLTEREIAKICKQEWSDFKKPESIQLKIQTQSFDSLEKVSEINSGSTVSVKKIDNPILNSKIIKFKLPESDQNQSLLRFSSAQNHKDKVGMVPQVYLNQVVNYLNNQIQNMDLQLFQNQEIVLDLTPYWGFACDLAMDTKLPLFLQSALTYDAPVVKFKSWLSMKDYSNISTEVLQSEISVQSLEDFNNKTNIVNLAVNLAISLEKNNLLQIAKASPQRLMNLYSSLEQALILNTKDSMSSIERTASFEKLYQSTFELSKPASLNQTDTVSAYVKQPKFSIKTEKSQKSEE